MGFCRITGKMTFSRREFGIDFSCATVSAFLDEAWSRGEAFNLGGKVKMNFKELMCGFIWGQKIVLRLRRVGQIIFL